MFEGMGRDIFFGGLIFGLVIAGIIWLAVAVVVPFIGWGWTVAAFLLFLILLGIND